MSREIGFLNRSLSYPSNLQRLSPNISISDLTPSPIPLYTINSPRMASDDNFTHTVFHTISQFKNSDIETDEFQNSEPSSFTFWQPPPPSVHSTPQLPMNLPQPFLPTATQPQLILSPMTSDHPDPPSPVNEELENELDNFIT